MNFKYSCLVVALVGLSWRSAYAQLPGSPQEAVDPTQMSERPSPSFQAGPVIITPSGFFELTSIYRTRNETADIGSSFGEVPFPSNNNYGTGEFRDRA